MPITALDELLGEKSDPLEISRIFKKEIKSYLESLEGTFEESEGKQFLFKHTKMIDMFVTYMYKFAIIDIFENYLPMSSQIPLTLCALGSYGREQLCVYSDIDIMITYKDVPGYNTRPLIEKILYTMWDSGMKLGHRVHEVSELQDAAKEDNTIKSALLESRFICGSKPLWFEVENGLQKIRKTNQALYVKEKYDEYIKRLKKHPVCMEPDVKEGFGGLRDANTLFWIATSLHNVQNLKELNSFLFSEEEYRSFRIAVEFLFRVRSALHLVAGKKQDRLALEQLPDVARMLGFDETPKKAQMRCATKTLQSMEAIHTFCAIQIRKLSRRFDFDATNIPKLRKAQIPSKRFFLADDYLSCSFRKKPMTLSEVLNLFLALPDRPITFDIRVLSVLYQTQLPDKMHPSTYEKFYQLMYRKHLHPILELLMKSNLLPFLCSSFKHIRFLPQFDGYHQMPVDYHTLACFSHLENIQNEFIRKLYESFSSELRALLKLTLLFHDLGKGRVTDHHIVGERMIRRYAIKLGLREELVDRAALLVEHHTLMSYVAQSEDIYNEKTLLKFVSYIKDKTNLELLYVLTYADVNGVGKGVMTKFLEKLLYELYQNSLPAFERTDLLSETARRLKKEESVKKTPEYLALSRPLRKKISQIPSNGFFLKHKKEEILQIIQRTNDTDTFSFHIDNENYLSIEIIRKAPFNLGYFLGWLSSMDIASMDVFKLFDDAKYFRLEFTEPALDDDLIFISNLVPASFDMEKPIKIPSQNIQPTEITINADYTRDVAEIRINTLDSKGLLAFIARVFDDLGMEIVSSKSHTFKRRVRDLFLIEKNESFWNNQALLIPKLTETGS